VDAVNEAYKNNYNAIDWSGTKRHTKNVITKPLSHTIMHDIEPFQTQEGEVIGSRRSLREYERSNHVRQSGNDWTGSERPEGWDARS
jgi:hypothetical protein